MQVKLSDIKKLRQETQAGVSDCRQALADAGGDYTKAKKLLSAWGLAKAAQKEGKETPQGAIASYVHADGKLGVLVELRCETDFVAKTNDFQNLAHEIALQVAAMNPKNVKELLAMAYVRNADLTIEALLKQNIAKVGENIIIARFSRLALEK